MSLAKKCDRCGTFHDTYNDKENPQKINSLITANADSRNKYYSHRLINLCPSCMNEFNGWLKNE